MKTRSYPLLSLTVGVFLTTAPMTWADASNMVPESVEHFSMVDADANDGLSPAEFENFVAFEAEDDIGASRRIKRFGGSQTGSSGLVKMRLLHKSFNTA